MIAGILHQSSGLGNQLHRYVATRVLAEDKGYEWGMVYNGNDPAKDAGFKGASFMEVDLGKEVPQEGMNIWYEKKIVQDGLDIRGYDPEYNFVQDGTVIEGEFQDERYFIHRLEDIKQWLKTEELVMADNVCAIGFRGGEYTAFPELFLTKDYWDEAIEKMKLIDPTMKFEVHTDDSATARQFFPDYPIVQEIGMNWRSIRYAKYSIIANSSFYILPRLLNGGYTIAPRYWARRNIGVWALPQNFYSTFDYI